MYAVRGAHDNIALYLDVVRHEDWIKNFKLIPDGKTCSIDEPEPNSLGFTTVSVGGIGGTYSPRVFEATGGLGYKDKRMQDAVDKVISRQNESGRWELKSTFNGRFQTNIEVKGKSSKWITLNALRVLKNYYNN